MTSSKFDNTMGALLIGSSLCMAVTGMAWAQTYGYYFNNQDNRLQHAFVAFLIFLDTLYSAMNAHMCYFYLVENYGNPLGLHGRTWSVDFGGLVMAFMLFSIRTVFAHRIYIFSGKNIILAGWIMSLTTSGFVAGLGHVKINTGLSSMLAANHKFLYATLSCGLMADLFISASLCWLLSSVKTGYRSTDSLVNTLMFYIMNTALVITLGFTAGLTSMIVMPSTMVFFCVFMVVPKLYTNAYLVSLNARSRLRGMHSSLGPSLSDLQYAAPVTSVDTDTHSSRADQKKVGGKIDDIVDSPDLVQRTRISVVQNEVEI